MEELERTFIEEYEGGIQEQDNNRYKNSTILLSKSMFALCDIMIYNKLKKLPKNHSERFRILEEYFQEVYKIVDRIFSNYTDAYSKPVLKETCEEIKNGIKEISKNTGLSEKIKKIIR